MRQSTGSFLLCCLDEAGTRHILGVAGEYNVEFTRQLEDRGAPAWIGTSNELKSSNSADGYARIPSLGATLHGALRELREDPGRGQREGRSLNHPPNETKNSHLSVSRGSRGSGESCHRKLRRCEGDFHAR
jgi:hypothetical protein